MCFFGTVFGIVVMPSFIIPALGSRLPVQLPVQYSLGKLAVRSKVRLEKLAVRSKVRLEKLALGEKAMDF